MMLVATCRGQSWFSIGGQITRVVPVRGGRVEMIPEVCVPLLSAEPKRVECGIADERTIERGGGGGGGRRQEAQARIRKS
jgi:hypothetical protein